MAKASKVSDSKCPHCGSKNVENPPGGDNSEVDHGEVVRDLVCGDCNGKWQVTYKLVPKRIYKYKGE